MNSWNLMTKSVGKKDKNIIDKYIDHEKKNSVLILGSPINMKGKNPDYAPSKTIVNDMMNINDKLIQKYPINKFYASQGGAKRKTGSALYNKNSNIIMTGGQQVPLAIPASGGAYRMRESTKRFLEGSGVTSSDYRPEYKMSKDNIISKGMDYVGRNILYPIIKPLLFKKKGGKKMKDMTPAELQALDDARIANAIWKKSKAGKERLEEFKDLTDREKLASARNTARKWAKEVYEPKVAQMKETRAQQQERIDQAESRRLISDDIEQRRLAQEAKRNSSVWDDIGSAVVGELVNLIPAPKFVKDVVKKGAQEGYKALSSSLQGKAKIKRKPSEWNIKVKAYMNKHNCSMKEALQNLKK
jgi:hypothetical protein